ncbi:helix-turn-helix domain-containing protein, partial [Vibrio cholerae]|nr:helix-turn-helix domain-containing protein [Vibrio cholerae]
MNYKQLTEGDRYTIAAYKKQGLSLAEIARLTGRHKSTIS